MLRRLHDEESLSARIPNWIPFANLFDLVIFREVGQGIADFVNL